ncbi:MAG: ATP-binding protein [Planctomycetota bacterium]|jgi:anti-sigma regulatory factor (Ser/Thr protein kinase)
MPDPVPNSTETPEGPPEIQLCILSQPRLLGAVRSMLESFADRIGFCGRGCGELMLAVDEALTNIIRHGYDHAPDCRIWLSLRALETPRRGIRVEIEDHQQGFDPERLPERDLDEVRPGGLGVHLMRSVTHLCRHEAREQGGMRLVIEKFCEDADPQDGPGSTGTSSDVSDPPRSNSPEDAM